jgi:hypothetical protein
MQQVDFTFFSTYFSVEHKVNEIFRVLLCIMHDIKGNYEEESRS